MADRNAEMTQAFSTFGNKLLHHTDVLHDIQAHRLFRPITIQLSPTEACDSDCPFCSVSGRPLKSKFSWEDIERVLDQCWGLGAIALELTGGGNPMLWADKTGRTINDIVLAAAYLGFRVGIITNSHNLSRLSPEAAQAVQWVRVSLIQLDEGRTPEDYTFGHVPPEKIGLSYIIYAGTAESPRTYKPYGGTTPATIEKIARLVELHPSIKFVRIAGDCLRKGSHPEVKALWSPIIEAVDRHQKFFIKDIGQDDGPFNDGCYTGLLRPYIAQSPDGTGRPQVYICTSHVLNTRGYDLAYSLGSIDEIPDIWAKANERFQRGMAPYTVKNNCGIDWEATCKFCYYSRNNSLIHEIAHRTPDWEFA